MADELLDREIKAIARDKLADVDDVVLLGDLDRFVDANGNTDAEAIAALLDALIERKPYLARPLPRRGPRPDMTLVVAMATARRRRQPTSSHRGCRRRCECVASSAQRRPAQRHVQQHDSNERAAQANNDERAAARHTASDAGRGGGLPPYPGGPSPASCSTAASA